MQVRTSSQGHTVGQQQSWCPIQTWLIMGLGNFSETASFSVVFMQGNTAFCCSLFWFGVCVAKCSLELVMWLRWFWTPDSLTSTSPSARITDVTSMPSSCKFYFYLMWHPGRFQLSKPFLFGSCQPDWVRLWLKKIVFLLSNIVSHSCVFWV